MIHGRTVIETDADKARKDRIFPYEDIFDTGLLDPVGCDQLYCIGRIDKKENLVTYCSMRNGKFLNVYTKIDEEPYFKFSPDGPWSGNNRFFAREDERWKEFESHIVWGNTTRTIYLPIDTPDDEVEEIKKILSEGGTTLWGGSVLPIAQKIAARTIGMDLVAVKPMSMPNATLIYSDFVYSGLKQYQSIKQSSGKRKGLSFTKNIKRNNGRIRNTIRRKS